MDNVDNHKVCIDVEFLSQWVHKEFLEGAMPEELNTEKLTTPPFDDFSLIFFYYTKELVFADVFVVDNEKSKNKTVTIRVRFEEKPENVDRWFNMYYLFDYENEPLENTFEIDCHYFDEFDAKMVSIYADCIYRRMLLLMNCKNIELKDEPLSRQQRRRKERKNEIIYKVLAIKEGSKSTRYLDHGHSGDKHAYHLCRGHFKTYTDDAPLFGRLTGTYWWPAHVRGSKEFGEVVKDYQVG